MRWRISPTSITASASGGSSRAWSPVTRSSDPGSPGMGQGSIGMAEPAEPVVLSLKTGFARPDGPVIAVLLTALVAFQALSTDMYLASLPALTRYFSTDVPTVQLTLSVFVIGSALGQLVYGPLSDRFGRRPMLCAGLSVYLASSIACVLAPTIE